MGAIKWLAFRRFNYIDSTGMTLVVLALERLSWVTALVVFVGGVLMSVAAEAIAKAAK